MPNLRNCGPHCGPSGFTTDTAVIHCYCPECHDKDNTADRDTPCQTSGGMCERPDGHHGPHRRTVEWL